MTQDKRVIRGKRKKYEEGVRWYIDEHFLKFDNVERSLAEVRRLSYKERRVNA